MGSDGTAPRILKLGTRWRWLVSFSPQDPRTHWIERAGWAPEPIYRTGFPYLKSI